MHQQFAKRQKAVRQEERVHLCDHVAKWYDKLVVGSAALMICSGQLADTSKPAQYAVAALSIAALATIPITAMYGVYQRTREGRAHIHHIDNAPQGDVVRIVQPTEYRSLE